MQAILLRPVACGCLLHGRMCYASTPGRPYSSFQRGLHVFGCPSRSCRALRLPEVVRLPLLGPAPIFHVVFALAALAQAHCIQVGGSSFQRARHVIGVSDASKGQSLMSPWWPGGRARQLGTAVAVLCGRFRSRLRAVPVGGCCRRATPSSTHLTGSDAATRAVQAPGQDADRWFKQARRWLRRLAADDATSDRAKRRAVIKWLQDVREHEPPWLYKKVVGEINVIMRQSVAS